MVEFIPQKLFLELQDEEYNDNNFIPRRYTLTHSDDTGQMFLMVGKDYDYSKINGVNEVNDEVLAEWEMEGDEYVLKVYIEVDENSDLTQTVERDRIFREELPLALKAIVYGDRTFLDKHEFLKDSSVVINFKSKLPEYNKVENWGTIKDYTYKLAERNFCLRQIDPQFIPPIIYPPTPGPGPSPGPTPPRPPRPPQGPPERKERIIEKALINTLSPYIKSEIYVAFGRNSYYCLTDAEIIRARTIRSYGPCSEEYEVIVGLKVGRRPPRENNIRITFVINENSVRVRDVDRPRPR